MLIQVAYFKQREMLLNSLTIYSGNTLLCETGYDSLSLEMYKIQPLNHLSLIFFFLNII